MSDDMTKVRLRALCKSRCDYNNEPECDDRIRCGESCGPGTSCKEWLAAHDAALEAAGYQIESKGLRLAALAVIDADEHGQGTPFAEAMDALVRALASAPKAKP
jgi:hypothetical protein